MPNERKYTDIQTLDDLIHYAQAQQFGDLLWRVDPEAQMIAVIAIHSTARGPSLGGCRFSAYANLTDAAMDALRLAQGMSYKSAAADLPLGGGKAVLIKPEGVFNRELLFQRFGQFVNDVGGRYITAPDLGTTVADMNVIAQKTSCVSSVTQHGDPSPHTATGLFIGMEAAAQFYLDRPNLSGLTILVQGLGHVGYELIKRLVKADVKIVVSDIDAEKVKQVCNQFSLSAVETDQVYTTPCDIFSPCARGGILNTTTIPQLNCKIVAGSANNQLGKRRDANTLAERKIVYVPDYIVNSGGLIQAFMSYKHHPDSEIQAKIAQIHPLLLDIFKRAAENNCLPVDIADQIAEEKFEKAN